MKYRLVIFTVILISFTACSSKAVTFPPYHFSADFNDYEATIDKDLIYQYVTMDYFSPSVKYIDDRSLTQFDLDKVMSNRNAEAIKSDVTVGYGFTRKSTNMKMLPSGSLFQKSAGSVFDYNQYTRIGAFSPLLILHTSSDNKYMYVQTDHMRGWLPSDDIEKTNKKTFDKVINMQYIQVVADDVDVAGITYNIGDKIPVLNKTKDNDYIVMSPNGKKVVADNSGAFVWSSQDYSQEMMRFLAQSQLDNPYDWGGREGYRDCSSYVRDMWLVFGVNLPRNTALQVQVGEKISGKPKSTEAFFKVLDNAEPFKTLIFFKGHVIMYGGKENDDYVIYHAVSRLKNDSDEIISISSVVKQNLKEDGFTRIWERVTKITDISGLIK